MDVVGDGKNRRHGAETFQGGLSHDELGLATQLGSDALARSLNAGFTDVNVIAEAI
jgi:hypothetical protein